MSTEISEEIKAIRVLLFQVSRLIGMSGLRRGIAAERGYLKIMLGREHVPTDVLDIDQKVDNKY